MVCAFTLHFFRRLPLTRVSLLWLSCLFRFESHSWSAKKQPTVARYSIEADYRAKAQAAAELNWIRMLLL